MEYKFKGNYWTNSQGCLITTESQKVSVYSSDTFTSLEEAKAEWVKDPWLENKGICVLATEIVEVNRGS